MCASVSVTSCYDLQRIYVVLLLSAPPSCSKDLLCLPRASSSSGLSSCGLGRMDSPPQLLQTLLFLFPDTCVQDNRGCVYIRECNCWVLRESILCLSQEVMICSRKWL